MPTYTFRCCNCNKEFDVTDKNTCHCIYCDGEVKRVYKPVGVIWNCDGNVGKIS